MTLPPLLAQAANAAPGSLAGHWTWLDWGVLVGYFLITTWIGHRLAGKQATIRDFFLGGRKLPWYAVAGSIIATEVSAVTFVSVPFVVFAGNFQYLQIVLLGTLLARLVVAYVLVPAYYQREIYSPYDYMGNQLGGGVRAMTTALFSLGGVLAQSARVYLTAVVLELVLRRQLGAISEVTGLSPVTLSIWLIGFVAVLWTLMGGIATVIWTDVILFLVFLIGAAVALAVVTAEVPGGLVEIFRMGWRDGKFDLWDVQFTPTKAYTLWAAAIASTWGNVGAYGTDQLMAQRIFCCNGPRAARRAVLWSWLGILSVTVIVMLVGVGLYAYYHHFPLQGEALTAFERKGDRIFPIFILSVIPPGLTGLIIAGIFAAAVSSLDSILAALAQTTVSGFYLPLRERALRRATARRDAIQVGLTGDALTAPENPLGPPGAPPTVTAEADHEHRHAVRVSRVFIIIWGIVLCAVAQLAEMAANHYPSILDLALAMAGYAGGALMAGFFLGFLPLRIDGSGYLFSAPLSVLTVFALAWWQPWANVVCWIGGGALLVAWLVFAVRYRFPRNVARALGQTLALLAGIALMLWVSHYGHFSDPVTGETRPLAWPWWAPIGSVIAFVWGYALAGWKPKDAFE